MLADIPLSPVFETCVGASYTRALRALGYTGWRIDYVESREYFTNNCLVIRMGMVALKGDVATFYSESGVFFKVSYPQPMVEAMTLEQEAMFKKLVNLIRAAEGKGDLTFSEYLENKEFLDKWGRPHR